MRAFARWYLEKLKTHPMQANLGSSFVLMTVGDILAQEIEINSDSSKKVIEQRAQAPPPPTISFRRYGTISPDVEGIKEQYKREREKDGGRMDRSLIEVYGRLTESMKIANENLREQVASLDFFRLTAMNVWAVGFYTPIYIAIYRLFDRFLPTRVTPASVFYRVFLSFVSAVPVNAAFYCYGSYIHHFTEWIALIGEWKHELHELGLPEAPVSTIIKEVPFDFDMAWSTARAKLEAELWSTTKTSAQVWIPINVINFSLVTPHLRPLVLMVCSAFWNTYMSLTQHRDVSI